MYTESTSSFEQPITFTTLDIVVDVRGETRRTVVPDDAVQVGVGRVSWSHLEDWMGEREIRSTITGPYFSYWETWSGYEARNDRYECRVDFCALALIEFDDSEDEVRWGRAVLDFCGRPKWYATCRYETELDPLTIQNQRMVGSVRCMVGGLPGEHRSVRTPVSVLN